MKCVFTFLLLLVCLTGSAQEELPTYNEVIEVSGATREELYGRAQQWLKHLNYQISFDEPESGFISVGGEMGVRKPGSRKIGKGRLIYVITLIVEEQKYWYDVSQFYYDEVPAVGRGKKERQLTASRPSPDNAELYRALDAKMRSEIEDLKRSMLVKSYAPADAVILGNK